MRNFNIPLIPNARVVFAAVSLGAVIASGEVVSSCGSGDNYDGGTVTYPAGAEVYENYDDGNFQNRCGVLSEAATDKPEGQKPDADPVAYSHEQKDLPAITRRSNQDPYDCAADKYVWLRVADAQG